VTDDDFSLKCQKISDEICYLANDGLEPADFAGFKDWFDRAMELRSVLLGWSKQMDTMADVAYVILEEEEEA